jgi:membrane glycosyltransferase
MSVALTISLFVIIVGLIPGSLMFPAMLCLKGWTRGLAVSALLFAPSIFAALWLVHEVATAKSEHLNAGFLAIVVIILALIALMFLSAVFGFGVSAVLLYRRRNSRPVPQEV